MDYHQRTDLHQEINGGFFPMLSATLDTLCNTNSNTQSPVQDDTILHRLLDIIKKLVVSPEDVHQSNLCNFLITVSKNVSNLHATIVVLALGVASHLVSVSGEILEKHLNTVTALYDSIQHSHAAENSSVGAAYFTSLVALTKTHLGWKWLEKKSAPALLALSTLKTARSIFLLNAAENFLVSAVTSSIQAGSPHDSDSSDHLTSVGVSEVMKTLTCALNEMIQCQPKSLDNRNTKCTSDSFHSASTQVLLRLCDNPSFCLWKMKDGNFLSNLAQISVSHSSENIRQFSLQAVIKLFHHMEASQKDELLEKIIMPPLLELLAQGEIERAVETTSCILNSKCNFSIEKTSVLQGVTSLPYDILFREQPHCSALVDLIPSVTALLSDGRKVRKLISSMLQTLQQRHNSQGFILFLQSASARLDDPEWQNLLSSWPEGIGPALMGNSCLLSCLLQLLQDSKYPVLASEEAYVVLKTLIHIMESPQVQSRLYSEACATIITIIRQRQHDCRELESVMEHLIVVLERHLVSMQWEIRDTTLELIHQLTCALNAHLWVHDLLVKHHFLRQAWSCLQDGESYPRASTVALATSYIQMSNWWLLFLEDCGITESDIVHQVMDILANDTEAIVRRAAVEFLSAIYFHDQEFQQPSASITTIWTLSQQQQIICQALKTAASDFDWEVKIKALEFWGKAAMTMISGQTCAGSPESCSSADQSPVSKSMLHRDRLGIESCSIAESCMRLAPLLMVGFEEVLLNGLEDYDSAVREKACSVLSSIHNQLGIPEHSLCSNHFSDNNCTQIKGDCYHPQAEVVCEKFDSLASRAKDSVHTFLTKLYKLAGEGLQKMQESSTDEYERNPMSLLEDVMSAVKATHMAHEITHSSEDEFDDGESIFVDCY